MWLYSHSHACAKGQAQAKDKGTVCVPVCVCMRCAARVESADRHPEARHGDTCRRAC